MLKYAEFVKAAQVAAPVPSEPTAPRKPTLGERIRGTYQKAKDKARQVQQTAEQLGQRVYDDHQRVIEKVDKRVQKWPEAKEKYQRTLDNVRDRYRRVKDALKPQGVPAAPQK